MAGGFEDVAGSSVGAALPAAEHVHPLLRRAGIAKTMLVLPHADLAVSGTVRFGGRELDLDGARGGQAHLWGSKHAAAGRGRTATTSHAEGEPRPGTFVDGVSVFVPRFGPRARAEHAGRRALRRRRLRARPARCACSRTPAASA